MQVLGLQSLRFGERVAPKSLEKLSSLPPRGCPGVHSIDFHPPEVRLQWLRLATSFWYVVALTIFWFPLPGGRRRSCSSPTSCLPSSMPIAAATPAARPCIRLCCRLLPRHVVGRCADGCRCTMCFSKGLRGHAAGCSRGLLVSHTPSVPGVHPIDISAPAPVNVAKLLASKSSGLPMLMY